MHSNKAAMDVVNSRDLCEKKIVKLERKFSFRTAIILQMYMTYCGLACMPLQLAHKFDAKLTYLAGKISLIIIHKMVQTPKLVKNDSAINAINGMYV